MAFAMQDRKTTSATTNVAQTNDATTATDKKTQLRGLSFDEGTKALTPEGNQQADAKKPDAKDAKNDKGPPPEIVALGLKKVKVECTLEVWASLNETERAGVLTFLADKERQCDESKKLKSSKVTITMGRKFESVDEKVIDEQNKKAQDNVALMNDGKTPKGDKTIGVKEGDVHVTETKTEKVTQVPITETKQMKDHFDAAGSTFDSADYKPEDMQQSGVIALLDQAAEKIKEYLALDPDAQVTLTVIASESHVTNPEQFKEPGSLAAARAANGVELAKAHFAALGIPTDHLSFTTQNLGANGPKWDPKAGISKHDPMYTAHQFVRLEVAAEVEVASEGTEEVKEPTTEETRTQDAQLIKMSVQDKRKMSSHKKNKTFTPKRTKRTRSGKTRKHGWGSVSCPTF